MAYHFGSLRWLLELTKAPEKYVIPLRKQVRAMTTGIDLVEKFASLVSFALAHVQLDCNGRLTKMAESGAALLEKKCSVCPEARAYRAGPASRGEGYCR
jgi:hypothetical protein